MDGRDATLYINRMEMEEEEEEEGGSILRLFS